MTVLSEKSNGEYKHGPNSMSHNWIPNLVMVVALYSRITFYYFMNELFLYICFKSKYTEIDALGMT